MIACMEVDFPRATGGVNLVLDVDCGHVAGDLKKRSPRHNLLKMKIPRLLVNDIRKLYVEMLVNVFNSQDIYKLYGFLDTYCVQNVQYRIARFSRASATKDFSLNINGIFEIAKYWYSIFRMSPDYVLKVFDVGYWHSSGEIECKMHSRSTYIYEFARDSSYYARYLHADKTYGSDVLFANDKTICDFVVGRRDRAECSTMREDLCRAENQQFVLKSIVKCVDNFVPKLPLRKSPLVVDTVGTCTISTDECKRITSIELCVSC